VILKVATLMVR